MGRTLSLVPLVILIALVPASSANAGGWDSLVFPDDHYLVGEVATTTQWFFAGDLRGAGPLDGRLYHAYLLPRGATERGLGMITPPTIPAGAIELSTLQTTGPFERPHYKGPYGRATLTFTVPEVPTGRYSIGFCDDPCEHGSVGWLAWATITIVHTEEEGRLLASLGRMDRQAWKLRSDLRRAERASQDLQDEAAALGEDVRERTLSARAAGTRIAALEAVGTPAPESRPLIPGWAAGMLAAAIIAAAVIARRRRSDVFVVPNTVPDDLVERDRAGV
ncbi:MAG TPA: hypothetical protein VF195_11295 [Actinomycetota bacterium]